MVFLIGALFLMTNPPNGELVPVGGGDPIPLIRAHMTLGRRESCDVCLRFPNISGVHCELSFRGGYWHVRDLNSTNGIKINGARIQEHFLKPRDELTIGKRPYLIEYAIAEGTPPPPELSQEDILSKSLLERAGLAKSDKRETPLRVVRPAVDPAKIDIDWEEELEK